MNPNVRIWILIVLMIAFLILLIFLVVLVKGHQMVGKPGVATMLVALVGLLAILWDYNRPYSNS